MQITNVKTKGNSAYIYYDNGDTSVLDIHGLRELIFNLMDKGIDTFELKQAMLVMEMNNDNK